MRYLILCFFICLLLIAGCSSPVNSFDEDPPFTGISFTIPESSRVVIWLENSYKTKVLSITDELYPAGDHNISFAFADESGNILPAGIYTIVMEIGDYSSKRPIFFTDF